MRLVKAFLRLAIRYAPDLAGEIYETRMERRERKRERRARAKRSIGNPMDLDAAELADRVMREEGKR